MTLTELVHLSMLLPDPDSHNEDEFKLNYKYDLTKSAELTFIRIRCPDRATWIFNGNVLLPTNLNSIEFSE